MPAQQVSDAGHADQHDGEGQVVAPDTPTEQHRIRCLVDDKPTGRHREEAQRRRPQRCPVTPERQSMVPREGHGEGQQPAEHIGDQRAPIPTAHQGDHNQPMHGRRGASDRDEPSDPTSLKDVTGSPGVREDALAHGAAEHSRRRAVCIAVDDFGLHAGINQAALRLAAMGHVQAIGCMVGGNAWPGWSQLLRRLEPRRVDLGLHLDLTESPLLLQPFQPLTRLIRECFLQRLDRKALRAEIRAQLDTFEQTVGRAPTYIDGHQHVHQFPIVRSELLEELGGRHGGSKPWLRSTRRARATWADPRPARRDLVKPWVIEQLGSRGLASIAHRMGYPQNAHLLGVYDFRGGPQRYRQLLAAWLSAASKGDLLMCHPSLPGQGNDPLIEARSAEFQVLSDPAFAVQLHDAGIDVQPMSRILV